MQSLSVWVFFTTIAILRACSHAADAEESLSFQADGNVAIVTGVIDENSPGDFKQFYEANPQVETLVFMEMPGSDNDEANLKLARYVRAQGLNTHLTETSDIASGATDLFMAGVERTIECGALFGVHSWKAIVIEDGVRTEYTARDIPRDPQHEDHKFFIDYYVEMGIPVDFYWYTVDVAPYEGIYNVEPEALEKYGIVTEQMNCE